MQEGISTNKTAKFFDDRDNLTGLHELSATGPNLGAEALSVRSDWNTVESKLITFAQNTRKDFCSYTHILGGSSRVFTDWCADQI